MHTLSSQTQHQASAMLVITLVKLQLATSHSHNIWELYSNERAGNSPFFLTISMFMDYELLLVTFYNDLPNFRMCLNLLSKFWQGNKKITIVYSLKTPHNTSVTRKMIVPAIENAVETFLYEWEYTVKEGQVTNLDGWDEQQVNKIFYSALIQSDYILVFDCKNFCTQPVCHKNFFKKDKIIVEVDSSGLEFVTQSKEYFNVKKYPYIASPLTPWVWDTKGVRNLNEYLINREGNISNWKRFPGSEYINYFFYKMFVEKDDIFLPINRRSDGIIHHHRTRNICEIYDVVNMLKNKNIEEQEIELWKTTIVPYAIYNLF